MATLILFDFKNLFENAKIFRPVACGSSLVFMPRALKILLLGAGLFLTHPSLTNCFLGGQGKEKQSTIWEVGNEASGRLSRRYHELLKQREKLREIKTISKKSK